MSQFQRVVIIAAMAVGVSMTAGCGRVTTVESAWPEAVQERSIPRPPGPPRWPLTGLDAPSHDAVMTRVVSVKVENSPQARPQTNLAQADVVYETVTEGGITRFNALFQSRSPKEVAPVRSARPSDLYIVPQYHAIFAHVGGDKNVKQAIAENRGIDDCDQFFNPSPYWRTKGRSAPHNMATDVGRIRAWGIEKRGFEASATIRAFPFDRTTSFATPTVTSIAVPFSDANRAAWRYDAGKRVYLRSTNGKPHTDSVTRAQYAARNVVVLWTQVKLWRKRDVAGSPVYNVVLTGSGRATVFRNGLKYDGTWTAGVDTPPVLKAADGTLVRLSPGITWFQVIGNGQTITFK